MRVVLFYHSLVSDWNHGNAHFLRGVAGELIARGHQVFVYEPADGWSRENLVREHGEEAIERFRQRYPGLDSDTYDETSLDLDEMLDGADLVIVHEWNSHDLVRRAGAHRARNTGYRLLFHDTHHRSVTDPDSMAAYDLRHYDGVLAFGEAIRQIYLERGWAQEVWTWHEAADTRVFRPRAGERNEGDLVWIGNWGDDERSAELREFLLAPVKELGLSARVHGVRYPEEAVLALGDSGIEYGGWLPNFEVPETFARFRVTLHVPRRPYASVLPGIPTIRPFEAMACGIPLVSAPWEDAEGLFRPGTDYLIARDGQEMKRHLRMLLDDSQAASHVAAAGLETILSRHTCHHRVSELLTIYESLAPAPFEAVLTGSARS